MPPPPATTSPIGVAAPETAAAAAQVRGELGRITTSRLFRQSARHRQLLHHLVERALAGDTGALKESLLAVEVFRRPLERFDPGRDTIVRVEARRLRQRLERYYREEGADADLEIRLPVGSYVPTVHPRAPGAPRAASLAARDLVERGMHFLREGGEPALRKALERFDTALRADPAYAPAYYGAARAWLGLVGDLYQPPQPWVDHATEALHRVRQLDPDHAEALTLLGSVLHRYHHDWPAAERAFRRAVAIAPRSAFARMGYGAHLALAGRPQAGEAQLQRARELDPHYLNARWQMALLRVGQRRFPEARREVDAILDLAPTHVAALHLVGALALYEGRPGDALEQYERVDAAAPAHPIGLAGVAQALGMLGDRAGAEAAAARLRARFAGLYVSPYQFALIALRCGDRDGALRQLEAGAATRDPNVVFALTDPGLDDLRDDERFRRFLRRHRLDAARAGPSAG